MKTEEHGQGRRYNEKKENILFVLFHDKGKKGEQERAALIEEAKKEENTISYLGLGRREEGTAFIWIKDPGVRKMMFEKIKLTRMVKQGRGILLGFLLIPCKEEEEFF